MPDYSAPVQNLLLGGDEFLRELRPTSVKSPERLAALREMEDAILAGGKPVKDPQMLRIVRAALFYFLDAMEDCHPIVQDVSSDTASYWHGMIHRREGDFENARYWFRSTGRHPAFAELHRRASAISADFAKQPEWDPWLFTGLCERAAFGEIRDDLAPLQRVEFETMLDYAWRHAVED